MKLDVQALESGSGRHVNGVVDLILPILVAHVVQIKLMITLFLVAV